MALPLWHRFGKDDDRQGQAFMIRIDPSAGIPAGLQRQ